MTSMPSAAPPAVGEVQYAYYEDLVKITKAFGVGICPVEKDALGVLPAWG